MISVGLTGNYGCGKSTVGRMLSELGASVLDADGLVHELLSEGGAGTEPVLAAFPAAAAPGGAAIDRRALADTVFEDDAALRRLEEILHPLVAAETRRRLGELEAAGCEIAVTEAALLFEAADAGTSGPGALARFDAVIVVTCDPAARRERLLAAAGEGGGESDVDRELERRLRRQMSQADKAGRADFIVDNSGSLDRTRAQVRVIHSALLASRDGGP